MKLLIDQNLSPKIVNKVKDTFPDIQHVENEGLLDTPDTKIFEEARKKNYQGIITKDKDMEKIVKEKGAPPKVLLLKTFNNPNRDVANVLITSKEKITNFMNSADNCLYLP